MAIAIDASTPVRASATAALTIATASFTAPTGSILVACVSSNTSAGGNPALTVTDSGGLTWTARVTRLQSQGGGSTGGTSAIWTAVTASSAARTVTATASGTGTAVGISVKCYVVTGGDTTTPNGATASGASQVNNTTTTAYVSTVNNSRGFVAATDWNTLGAPTSTDTGDGANVTGDVSVLSAFKSADTATSGTSVTFNLDAAGASIPDWTWASLEIRPGAGAPAAVPYAPRQQFPLRDPGESYFAPLFRRSAPGLLGTALLENELLGGATSAQRANLAAAYASRRVVPLEFLRSSDPVLLTTAQLEVSPPPPAQPAATHARPSWRRQDQPKADQSAAAPAGFDPTLAGLATARAMPATHDDRRLVPQPPPRFAAVDVVISIGTGATGAWWSDDPAVAYIAATQPRRSDPSLLDPPATPADPLQFAPQTAVRTPATHADRREVPQQRSYPAPPDTVTAIGTGRLNAWWSDDPQPVFMAATMPRAADPSVLTQTGPYDPTLAPAARTLAGYVRPPAPPLQRPAVVLQPDVAVPFDPTLAGTTNARLAPATHDDRRLVPAQPPRLAPVDSISSIGTGATNAWWSTDDAAHFGPAQRKQLADQSSQPVSTPFDPTLAPAVTARLAPATHAPRPRPPAQRGPAAVPDVVVAIGTGATNAWWSVDDWAHFGPAQRRQSGVPDDTVIVGTGAMVAWWGVDDTASYLGQRRPFDVGILAPPPVPFDPTLAGDPWRRYLLPAYADRREVPQQPKRQTLYFDAGPGLPPLTLAWGAGGAYWHLYNRPSRPHPFWPQGRPFAVMSDCDCQTHRPNTGITFRPGGGTTTRPSAGVTTRPGSGTITRPSTGITVRPCTCSGGG